jgi:hypothetical protein
MNDIEIYIKDPDPQAVEAWLQRHFGCFRLMPSPSGKVFGGQGERNEQSVPVKLFLGAVGKYASLCFDSPESPWDSDLGCARDAWQALGREIRCATGEWQEGSEVEDGLWWSLTEKGETQIQWRV